MSFQDTYVFPNKPDDILLIGEILIDELTIQGEKKSKRFFGGSPANVTINLNSLGIQPKFFGTVGNDDLGLFLINEFKTRGISSDYIKTNVGKTSVVGIRDITNTPKLTFNRESDYQINYTNELESVLTNVKIVHFSYWPLSKEPARSTIEKVVEFAKRNNITIGFDPNYHKELKSQDGISIEDLKILIGKVDIIKPSLDDSQRIFGEGYSVLEYLSKYEKLGCKLIVMTLGKEGVIASYKGEILKLPSMAYEIVDVTGAGDSFWSGLYAAILAGETIENAIKIGLKCSSYSLRQAGAITNLPKLSQLKKEI
ncbi:MAG: carbohydrate kinase [Candidatus Izimaplasma sp.]|nr:carbohydrate kinase [Candidatus Izimaplasma bacterium]